MRRWNGWGDEGFNYPLAPRALAFLEGRLGPGLTAQDASLADILARVPPSRLPPHPLVVIEPGERAVHARGQSLPDWIALRFGTVSHFPDGVAFPQSDDEIREILAYAQRYGIRLIPYGGGTSVAGHINVQSDEYPVLTVDLRRMNRLLDLDEESHLATFEAGIQGPDVEAALRARGYTLGHYPQSFAPPDLGGWVCTRSSGQQSLGYGKIERLFAGGRLETPEGTLILPVFPASAAGPDLRELVLGSEGRFGFLTKATVRVRWVPEKEDFLAIFFPDFSSGTKAVKDLVLRRLPLTMLRLSDAAETETLLTLAGQEGLVNLLERYLGLRGASKGKCLLLYGLAGSRREISCAVGEVNDTTGRLGGVPVGRPLGRQWLKTRFKTPYLRNTLWRNGYAVDTLETAIPWGKVTGLVQEIEEALQGGLAQVNERVHVFSHLSHVYPDGSSIYTTYFYRLTKDPEENLRRWGWLKGLASRTIVAWGGTISHHHGVGEDHRSYLPAEKGRLGMRLIEEVGRVLDPFGLMNPGKLFVSEK
ncbi:MAG: FAD-binding oxidoreductase [Firmicutes bacterium]|nr:FAD-binding oxidoreductase [Bacillota bacterium]